MMDEKQFLNIKKKEILNALTSIWEFRKKEFIPGKNKIHYSEPIFNQKEVYAVLDSLIDGWLAEGKKTKEFEDSFSKFIGMKECVVVNSGSSALLLAFRSLMVRSQKIPLVKGDEVITTALTFPTTLNAIILNGLVPVMVDVEKDTLNMDSNLIESMITDKTKALLVVHHLGNPCNMDKIIDIAKKNNLYVVEDCCDAHGAEYKGKKVGSFGDISCFSFYCAHAMTMGEGGAVLVKDSINADIIRSLKTCGRACMCSICKVTIDPNYNCPIRWSEKEGFKGADKRTLHLYIGYKFKILDLQSAFGIEQLKRLPCFVDKRLENFNYLREGLKKYESKLLLPSYRKEDRPSWFSFHLAVRENMNFTRKELIDHLEKNNIETRPLLGGNILKQPAYREFNFKKTNLNNTDYFHDNGFYIGCHPGITKEMMDFIIRVFDNFFNKLDE